MTDTAEQIPLDRPASVANVGRPRGRRPNLFASEGRPRTAQGMFRLSESEITMIEANGLQDLAQSQLQQRLAMTQQQAPLSMPSGRPALHQPPHRMLNQAPKVLQANLFVQPTRPIQQSRPESVAGQSQSTEPSDNGTNVQGSSTTTQAIPQPYAQRAATTGVNREGQRFNSPYIPVQQAPRRLPSIQPRPVQLMQRQFSQPNHLILQQPGQFNNGVIGHIRPASNPIVLMQSPRGQPMQLVSPVHSNHHNPQNQVVLQAVPQNVQYVVQNPNGTMYQMAAPNGFPMGTATIPIQVVANNGQHHFSFVQLDSIDPTMGGQFVEVQEPYQGVVIEEINDPPPVLEKEHRGRVSEVHGIVQELEDTSQSSIDQQKPVPPQRIVRDKIPAPILPRERVPPPIQKKIPVVPGPFYYQMEEFLEEADEQPRRSPNFHLVGGYRIEEESEKARQELEKEKLAKSAATVGLSPTKGRARRSRFTAEQKEKKTPESVSGRPVRKGAFKPTPEPARVSLRRTSSRIQNKRDRPSAFNDDDDNDDEEEEEVEEKKIKVALEEPASTDGSSVDAHRQQVKRLGRPKRVIQEAALPDEVSVASMPTEAASGSRKNSTGSYADPTKTETAKKSDDGDSQCCLLCKMPFTKENPRLPQFPQYCGNLCRNAYLRKMSEGFEEEPQELPSEAQRQQEDELVGLGESYLEHHVPTATSIKVSRNHLAPRGPQEAAVVEDDEEEKHNPADVKRPESSVKDYVPEAPTNSTTSMPVALKVALSKPMIQEESQADQKHDVVDAELEEKPQIAGIVPIDAERTRAEAIAAEVAQRVAPGKIIPGGIPLKKMSDWTIPETADWMLAVTGNEGAKEKILAEEIDGDVLFYVSYAEIQEILQLRFGPAKKLEVSLKAVKEYQMTLARS